MPPVLSSNVSPKGLSLIRATICIVCVTLVGAVSVWLLNRTSEKVVYINAVCEKLSLPVPLSVKLDQLESVHLNGYKGHLGRMINLKIRTNRLTEAFGDKTQITFSEKSAGDAGALSPPSFLIQPQPSYGEMTIGVGENAELRIPQSAGSMTASLEVESNRPEDTKLKLEMDAVNVEANRVVVQELKGVKALEGEDSFKIFAANKMGLVQAEFASLQPPDRGPRTVALIIFKEPKGVPLISSEDKPVEINGQLSLSACLDPEIKIAGEDPPKKIKANPLDLKFDTKGMVLTEIMIDPSPSYPAKYALRVKGKGTAESVRQDNRELISTTLEEILNKPPAEKGLYGLGALLCMFAGSVFLKRALDVLAEILIPGEKTKNGGKGYDAIE